MKKSPSGKVQWKDAPYYPVKEEAFSGNRLWRILQRDEYDLLTNAPMLEGNFVQVTKKGEHISILNHPTVITIGILATSPKLLFPDLMIIAREKRRRKDKSPMSKDLEITRLVSLEMVELFIDNLDEQRIKVQMMKGQKYYLRLYAPGQDESLLFDQWLRLIYLMHLARGRIKRPPSFTFKEPGQRSTSVLGLATKKHWLPAVMDKSSTGRLKTQLWQIYSSKETQSSVESINASKQSLLKSDLAAFSSPLATSGGRQRASKGQSLYTDSRGTKRSQAPQAGSSNFLKPESKGRTKLKQMSPRLLSKRILGSATRSEGTRHPQTQVMSQAVAPSPAAHQTSATGPSQVKNIKQPSVVKPGNVLVSMTSTHSGHTPVKLQKSKKSRALKVSSESERKKATVKSQKRSPVPRKSLVPPTQDRHGTASKTSSVMPSSGLVSSTTPFTSPAPVCHVSAGAAGPSEKQTVSVAIGSSEAMLVSIASGPSVPTTQGTQVVAEVHGSSEKSREPRKPMSRRLKASSSPSPKQGRSTSPNPTEKENVVTLHRTMECVAVGPSQLGYKSVAVGPSTPDNMLTSRPQSRALGTEKQSGSGDRSHGRKVKDKKSNQPSSKTGKQKKSRSKESESKSKVKSALSSAKQKSSLTFITLYSVLSLSFDKIKQSMSKDDSKVVSRKPSKRVTISGVDGPSGKGVQQPEEAGDSAKNRLSTSPGTDTNPVDQK